MLNLGLFSRASRLALFCLLLPLGACTTMEGVHTLPLAGRDVEYVLAGSGAPAVVFENGLGGRLQWWAKVLPDVAKVTTAFAYNRAGTGNSVPAATPRDGDTIVEELRRNLLAAGLVPPYVLVGHSLGGLYMQLYGRRYPQEVAGLVLVDSTHPEQMKGTGAKENWPSWLKLMFDVSASATAQKELDAVTTTGAAMLALVPLTGKPVIVLSAKKPMSESSALADDANAKRADIARLHPGSKQVWVDSGHAIPLEDPQAVTTAILEVLASVRRSVN